MKSTGPRPLRTQLLLSFAAVALVALTAATAAVAWLILDYQTQATAHRLRDAAGAAGGAAAILARQGYDPPEIAASLASQVPLPQARVLVLDAASMVVAEAEVNATGTGAAETPATADGDGTGTGAWTASFIGQTLDVPAPAVPAGAILSLPSLRGGWSQSSQENTGVWRGEAAAGHGGYVFSTAPLRQPSSPSGRRPASDGSAAGRPAAGRGPGGPPAAEYSVVLAVPEDTLPSAWRELAPGVALALGVALLAAGGVAWRLADSVARPIRTVTGAAERIARGEPHQAIAEAGVLEVTQLARSFNTMVGAVERSHRTLREFVANASHELRTPLTAIQGFSQAVEDGVLEAPEPTRDAVRHIHREAERMRRLVEDLLLLSRVEARDRKLTREDVDLADLLDTLEQRVRPAARERRQRLEMDLPDHLVVPGDVTELDHLFRNLLDNAVKYAPDGATIAVRADGRPGRVTVSVHDTGSVIAPEDRPHVFERFYRADKSRSRAVAGSGLGLAIAHEVAQRHGGTISVDSRPEAGTTFTVSLPAGAGTGTLPAQRAGAAPAAPFAAAGRHALMSPFHSPVRGEPFGSAQDRPFGSAQDRPVEPCPSTSSGRTDGLKTPLTHR